MNESDLTNLSEEEIKQAIALGIQALKLKKLDFPDQGTRGPKPTKANAEALFKFYGIVIRHNEMTKESEIDIPGKTFHRDTEMNSKLAYIMDLYAQQGLPTTAMNEYITLIANENNYHPVRDWIDSCAWDGVSRLNEYYNTIETDDELHIDAERYLKLKQVMMRKWALSGVAALYHRDFGCEGVLCLYGEQAAGKTTWIQSLLPNEHQTEWFKDGVALQLDNKDSLMKTLSTWITELGEIDSTFKKSDIEQLKGFITERVDVLRPPYERKANKYARRTILLGTMNQQKFLRDDQNRRFWPINVKRIIPAEFDAQQFWAEMKVEYLRIRDLIKTPKLRAQHNEYGWYLSPDERRDLEFVQGAFKTEDPIEELMENRVLLPTSDIQGKFMNSTAILMECGKANPTRSDLVAAGKWLRTRGFKMRKDTKQYLVWIPPVESPEKSSSVDYKSLKSKSKSFNFNE